MATVLDPCLEMAMSSWAACSHDQNIDRFLVTQKEELETLLCVYQNWEKGAI
jgi:hypothetical protein